MFMMMLQVPPIFVVTMLILMPPVTNGQYYVERLPPRSRAGIVPVVEAAALPNGVTSPESSTVAAAAARTTPVASGENKLFWNRTKTTTMMSQSANDEELLPTLANGHLGFTVFGDAIYMNGLYNGHRGLSHRARIANIANIRLSFSGGNQPPPIPSMDFESGTFRVDYRGPNNSFRVVQLIYPHQLYNRAIVNQFTIERIDGKDDIRIGIKQDPTIPNSEDIAFSPVKTIFISSGAERKHRNRTDEYSFRVYQTCGTTRELEDPEHHRNQQRQVCVLWNHVPEELTLERSESAVSYKFIMTADESANLARQDLTDALRTANDELLRLHGDLWRAFWNDFDITAEGNPTLERIIRASVFYLISNFPLNPSRSHLFGGLSPTGLGRGGSNLDDYEGHSFWDTEIWMFPVVNLIESRFAEMMVDYRFRRMDAARQNALASGFRGANLTNCLCSNQNDDIDDDDNSIDSGNKTHSTDLDKAELLMAPPFSNWSSLAKRLKLLYDTVNDYHPQFEGYRLGTVIKQADTVLLGYPLQYPGMGASTRSNDLRFYESVTRRSGPAMTWAMHAISHLDLGELEKGSQLFDQSYKKYVREPFLVWSEVEPGIRGASNFITGAGGFLQAVINGFGGVRLFLDRMEIQRPMVPMSTRRLSIKGVRYLGAILSLTVSGDGSTLEFTSVTRDMIISIGDSEFETITVNKVYDTSDAIAIIKAKDSIYKNCNIPEEVISTVHS